MFQYRFWKGFGLFLINLDWFKINEGLLNLILVLYLSHPFILLGLREHVKKKLHHTLRVSMKNTGELGELHHTYALDT